MSVGFYYSNFSKSEYSGSLTLVGDRCSWPNFGSFGKLLQQPRAARRHLMLLLSMMLRISVEFQHRFSRWILLYLSLKLEPWSLNLTQSLEGKMLLRAYWRAVGRSWATSCQCLNMLEVKINLSVNLKSSGAVPLVAEGVDCRGCGWSVDKLLELPEGADVKLVHIGCWKFLSILVVFGRHGNKLWSLLS